MARDTVLGVATALADQLPDDGPWSLRQKVFLERQQAHLASPQVQALLSEPIVDGLGGDSSDPTAD